MTPRVVLVAATALVLLTSCTRVVDDARGFAAPNMGSAGATAADCTSVDVPLTTIPSQDRDEPVLKVPQPAGWERVRMMDSELIRYTMRNTDLVSAGFAPTAVVTLESRPGLIEPNDVFDAQRKGLRSGIGARDMQSAKTTLCGLPAEMVDYEMPSVGGLPPHPARVLCAVLQTDGRTFAMTLTVQSADPGNPTYQRDAETILTGFQMLSPA
ncbi:LpqN/LpqT family lipoprotein [Mycobacterium sp. NBC_00419]|uniref:LpqN/LpqT family lipoprotein n=1 Tax=Mycobacterium sp. NBC_00419 TaxID=2975989 RepID=UPI002E23B0AA